MKTVCQVNKCNACMACMEKCPKNAITIIDSVSHCNAIINELSCVNCDLCKKICPNNNLLVLNSPKQWLQGWSNEYRFRSSSGGLASKIMKEFISLGGYVASCVFDDGCFRFKLTNELSFIDKFQGSKYVKSNPIGIYSEISAVLNKGFRVLFIGLPCQVAGIKKFTNFHKNLYCIDLICHGTPSQKILNKYLEEKNIKLSEIKEIQFREKNDFRLIVNGKRLDKKRITDFYMLGFLEGLFYTENCYECRFAKIERIGDLTLGDSWGSDLFNETKNGISLALVQNEKGNELITISGATLFPVSKDKAVENNGQLKLPSTKNKKSIVFFDRYSKNNRVRKNLKYLYPSVSFKNFIKKIVLK